MEPWEALDIDDSEVSSFLRPSKRQALSPDAAPPLQRRLNRTLTLNPSPPASILRPCSQLLAPQEPSISQPTPNSQILASVSIVEPETSRRLLQQLESSKSLSRRIPGPAGAVQVAMQRKVRNSEVPVQGDDRDASIPTQEYLRRAVENGDEDDGDFALNPWVCAVDFVRREGLVGGDGVAIGTPLCSIKNGNLTDKVAQVVAIIKSCNPNGLGDLLVTLKDPTGSIGATIHRKVLNYGRFGKDITVGAVLILQKVAMFSPARSACYFNITLSNVVKVISKDIGPISEQTCLTPPVKHTSVAENYGKSSRPKAAVPQLRERIDGIMNSSRQSANTSANTLAGRHSEQHDDLWAVDSYSNLSRRGHSSSMEMEPVSIRNDAGSRLGQAEMDVLMTHSNPVGVSESGDGMKQGNGQGGYSTDSNTIGNSGMSNTRETSQGAEGGKINGIKELKGAAVSKSSLPEWTDEQLEELFEYDL